MFNPLFIVAAQNFQRALRSKDTDKCQECAKYEECTMVGKANCLEFEEVDE